MCLVRKDMSTSTIVHLMRRPSSQAAQNQCPRSHALAGRKLDGSRPTRAVARMRRGNHALAQLDCDDNLRTERSTPFSEHVIGPFHTQQRLGANSVIIAVHLGQLVGIIYRERDCLARLAGPDRRLAGPACWQVRLPTGGDIHEHLLVSLARTVSAGFGTDYGIRVYTELTTVIAWWPWLVLASHNRAATCRGSDICCVAMSRMGYAISRIVTSLLLGKRPM